MHILNPKVAADNCCSKHTTAQIISQSCAHHLHFKTSISTPSLASHVLVRYSMFTHGNQLKRHILLYTMHCLLLQYYNLVKVNLNISQAIFHTDQHFFLYCSCVTALKTAQNKYVKTSNIFLYRYNTVIKSCHLNLVLHNQYQYLLLTGRGHILPLTFTQMPGGKQSSCSQDVSSRQNLICTCKIHHKA